VKAGLAAQALLKWGQASRTARKALSYISAKEDATGAWGTTQATIMVLGALLLAAAKGSSNPETWVTECNGYMGNTFAPKGFSSRSSTQVSRSKDPRSSSTKLTSQMSS